MILPIIMAGGSGTRLWPLSRGNYPKQFLSLNGDKTMLQDTLARLDGISHSPAMLICNEEHRFIAAEQVRQLGAEHSGIFLEPVGRNTAPAIALAAFKAIENNEDPLLLVLAADHVIEDISAFQASVEQASILAKQGKLVTFGITGNKPETGYGYIKRGAPHQTGFVVDSLIGQEEVVIKPLDRLLHGTPGMAGATITSDGGIALIIDVPNMLKYYAKKSIVNKKLRS